LHRPPSLFSPDPRKRRAISSTASTQKDKFIPQFYQWNFAVHLKLSLHPINNLNADVITRIASIFINLKNNKIKTVIISCSRIPFFLER